MNITFIIGNGFDMGLGLESGYEKVIENYNTIPSDDKIIKPFKRDITENKTYWSDFEMAMGKYTSEFSIADKKIYDARMEDFSAELIRYLQRQENRINIECCKGEITAFFRDAIEKFYFELSKRFQKIIKNLIETTAGKINYKFISFNYTHTLDNCLKTVASQNKALAAHNYQGSRYAHEIDTDVIHIHGELPGPIIMGLNDSSQISNQDWASDDRFKKKYIKYEINRQYGTLLEEDALNLINSSSIICIYGMSLGETDKIWWSNIAKWLLANNHYLIIFGHGSDNQIAVSYARIFEKIDLIRDKFLNLSNIGNEKQTLIEQKIFVVPNSKLFSLNLVNLTNKYIIDLESKEKIIDLESEYKKTLIQNEREELTSINK